MGHSTAVLDIAGIRVITDPLLRSWHGPLRRRPPLCSPSAWYGADVVLISHLHHDHCDLPTLRRLRAEVVVVPPGSAEWFERKGVPNTRELEIGSRVRLPVRGAVLQVEAAAAHHPAGRSGGGPSAPAVSYLLRLGGCTVWVGGDTGWHDGFARVRHAGEPPLDLALVPVGGWGHTLGEHHLDPEQAARAVAALGARIAIPVHWGTLHVAGLARTLGSRWHVPGPRFAAALRLAAPSCHPLILPPGGHATFGHDGARASLAAG